MGALPGESRAERIKRLREGAQMLGRRNAGHVRWPGMDGLGVEALPPVVQAAPGDIPTAGDLPQKVKQPAGTYSKRK